MLIQCPECKKEISSQADKCPHCGYVVKRKKSFFEFPDKRIIGIILLITVIIVITFAVKSKAITYKRYNGEKYNFTAIYPKCFNIVSSEKSKDMESLVLSDKNNATIYIVATQNTYKGTNELRSDCVDQGYELTKDDLTDDTYEYAGKSDEENSFCGLDIIRDSDLLFINITYPKSKEQYYHKIYNKMANYFKDNNGISKNLLSKNSQKESVEKENNDSKHQNIALFAIEDCLAASYNSNDDAYYFSEINVRNKTGKEIKNLTLTIQYLDHNKDIVYETYPQVEGPISDQQTIMVSSMVEKSLKPYYIKVVKYEYYDISDSDTNNVLAYEDKKAQLFQCDINSTDLQEDSDNSEQSVYQKVSDIVIDEVKSHLKSPGTAKFSDTFDINKTEIVNTTFYYVTGYVDSENGFGALLRSNFKVTVKYTDDKYEIDDIEFEK